MTTKTPRYTPADLAKQPKGGYRTHAQTDIRRLFARIRAEQKAAAEAQAAAEAEAAIKVQPMRKAAK